MGRKEITTKEDLMKVIELFENTGITYWLDGGWGVDIKNLSNSKNGKK